MSKEELLKYLIAEIDLIMHDKDYRFENEDGTWYSRESCKDLTNEEVFEELKTELRQLADLETKLAESEKNVEFYQERCANLSTSAYGADLMAKDVQWHLEKEIAELKQQLAEKDKEIISLECVISEIHNDIKELHEFKVGEDEYDLTDSDARFSLQCDLLNNEQDKIEFAIERLEKVKEFFLEEYRDEEMDTDYIITKDAEKIADYLLDQINELKGKK